MVDAGSTVDGRSVKVTVCRRERVTCDDALTGAHGDHDAASIMGTSALVDHRSPR
jgi:hypothetical protein